MKFSGMLSRTDFFYEVGNIFVPWQLRVCDINLVSCEMVFIKSKL